MRRRRYRKRIFWLRLGLGLAIIGLSACSASPGVGPSGSSGTPQGAAVDAGQAGVTSAPGPTETSPGNSGKQGKATIVFSTFFPNERLEQAKKGYEAAHPNITIELKEVHTDDAHLEAEEEKYITATNAAMLSGKGPDMLTLDVLPSEKYVGQHLLADLSDMLKKDPAFIRGDYFNNILENSQTNGGLYGIPISFFLNALIGNETAIQPAGVPFDDKTWTWETYAETLKQLNQKGSLANVPPASSGIMPAQGTEAMQALLSEMVKENYTRFVDEEKRKANFETAAFTDMMQMVKQMYDQGVFATQRGGAYFRASNINSAWDYLVSMKETGTQSRLYAKPRAEGVKAGGYFYPYLSVGINEKSPVKEEAWAFLQYLMSEAVQPAPERAGFPINKKAYQTQVQQLLAAGTVKAYEEGPLHGAAVPVDPAQLKQLEGYLSEAVHPVAFQPTKIEEIVMKESQSFFSGQKPVGEVAKLIQNKVMTYLNE